MTDRFPVRNRGPSIPVEDQSIAWWDGFGDSSLDGVKRLADGAPGEKAAAGRETRSRVLLLAPLALLLVAIGGCQTSGEIRRYSRVEAQRSLNGASGEASDAGLVLGEFRLHPTNAIMDGDTIRVEGLDTSLRLLAIDTEETFKNEQERAAYRAGWEEYKRNMRGDSPRPVKMATPLGEEATRWAEEFFKGSRVVRLERDHPGEIRGFYDRYLVYVFAEKDGEWVNYNLECVRAGMSPYFQKYGRSRRFHEEFVQAQAEARAAKRGIWSDDGEHYDDYDERLEWWDARGNSVWSFEEQAADRPNWIVLTRFDAMRKLEQHVGKDVVVLGTVGNIRENVTGPTIVNLSRDRSTDLPLVFFDSELFEATGLKGHRSEYVAARGTVSRYQSERSGRSQLQIIVNHRDQIIFPDTDGALVVDPAWSGTSDEASAAVP